MSWPLPGDPFWPRRRPTREVLVGEVGIGGSHPIRVQSMTTTDTRDVAATVAQIETLAAAGCEIVRLTVPSLREAESLPEIRQALERHGVRVPLVADIHFTPRVALLAAEWVEKVRVNPGNFADKKRFEVREYTDPQYREEVERAADRFRPLVSRCRELGRSLRIGTNHGSLSDRILNRFGDTPAGMVESALEFLDVCEQEGFRDVVFSMKASNPQVAVQAYRLLAARLRERAPEEPGYPFHLGVTEAGGGEEGRVKSAIGIGALLEDGLGDTVRVSLTEDPVRELPVARALARRAEARWARAAEVPAPAPPGRSFTPDPMAYARRRSCAVRSGGVPVGAEAPVRVELELGEAPESPEHVVGRLAAARAAGGDLDCEAVRLEASDGAALDRVRRVRVALSEAGIPAPVAVEIPASLVGPGARAADRLVVRVDAGESDRDLGVAARTARHADLALEWSLSGEPRDLGTLVGRAARAAAESGLLACLVSLRDAQPVHGVRRLAAELAAADLPWPLVLRAASDGSPAGGGEAALVALATDLGAPLCDGIGDAVAVPGGDDPAGAVERAYRILQGARLRTSWTEFISCPSCGRTRFDLEETTARIQERTRHLKGVKIAIMGCIVNGPGEMADADFGYVGSGPGLVNLYVGKELVARHLPAAEADDRLVELIRKHGRWTDPPGGPSAGARGAAKR